MTPIHDPDLVFTRVQRCMENLVGGSGHLASYRLRRDTFELTETSDLGDGLTEYRFTVEGVRVSEFTDPATSGDDSASHPEGAGKDMLRGTIVLDADGELALDEDGRARFGPWRTLDPELWPGDEEWDVEEFLDGLKDGEQG